MSIEFFDEFKEIEEEVLINLAKKEKANIVKEFSIIYPYDSLPEGLVIMITDTSLNVLGFAKFKEERSYFDLKYIVENAYELRGFTVDPLFFNVSEQVGLMADDKKVVGFENDEPTRLVEDTCGEGFNFIDEKGNVQFAKYNEDENGLVDDDTDKDIDVKFQGLLGEVTIDKNMQDKSVLGEENDVVNQPSHYTFSDKFEVIDIVEEISSNYPAELAFAIGNAVKYISRAEHKNGKQDIAKSIWYLNRVLEKWDDAHE